MSVLNISSALPRPTVQETPSWRTKGKEIGLAVLKNFPLFGPLTYSFKMCWNCRKITHLEIELKKLRNMPLDEALLELNLDSARLIELDEKSEDPEQDKIRRQNALEALEEKSPDPTVNDLLTENVRAYEARIIRIEEIQDRYLDTIKTGIICTVFPLLAVLVIVSAATK